MQIFTLSLNLLLNDNLWSRLECESTNKTNVLADWYTILKKKLARSVSQTQSVSNIIMPEDWKLCAFWRDPLNLTMHAENSKRFSLLYTYTFSGVLHFICISRVYVNFFLKPLDDVYREENILEVPCGSFSIQKAQVTYFRIVYSSISI